MLKDSRVVHYRFHPVYGFLFAVHYTYSSTVSLQFLGTVFRMLNLLSAALWLWLWLLQIPSEMCYPFDAPGAGGASVDQPCKAQNRAWWDRLSPFTQAMTVLAAISTGLQLVRYILDVTNALGIADRVKADIDAHNVHAIMRHLWFRKKSHKKKDLRRFAELYLQALVKPHKMKGIRAEARGLQEDLLEQELRRTTRKETDESKKQMAKKRHDALVHEMEELESTEKPDEVLGISSLHDHLQKHVLSIVHSKPDQVHHFKDPHLAQLLAEDPISGGIMWAHAAYGLHWSIGVIMTTWNAMVISALFVDDFEWLHTAAMLWFVFNIFAWLSTVMSGRKGPMMAVIASIVAGDNVKTLYYASRPVVRFVEFKAGDETYVRAVDTGDRRSDSDEERREFLLFAAKTIGIDFNMSMNLLRGAFH